MKSMPPKGRSSSFFCLRRSLLVTHRTRMPWLLFGSLQPMPMNEKLPLFDGLEMRQPDQIFSARVL